VQLTAVAACRIGARGGGQASERVRLQVACGGHCTLAVCCHDAERDAASAAPRASRGRVRAWLASARVSIDAAPRCASALGIRDGISTALRLPMQRAGTTRSSTNADACLLCSVS